MFHVFQRRFEHSSVSLANWALKARGRNTYIPFGCTTYVSSFDEWLAESAEKRQRHEEHLERQAFQMVEKLRREDERAEAHEARVLEGEDRAVLVRELNQRLSSVTAQERLKLIAQSDMPLESVESGLLDDVVAIIPSVDDETANILLMKIDRRNHGPWGKIKRTLNAR